MRKKTFILLTIGIIMASVCLSYVQAKYFSFNIVSPSVQTRSLRADRDKKLEEARLQAIYDLNMVLEKTPSGTMNTYLPHLVFVEQDTASAWKTLFRIDGEMAEEDERFVCHDAQKTLSVYKNDGLLELIISQEKARTGGEQASQMGGTKTTVDPSAAGKPINGQEAVTIAVQTVEEHFLFLSYEEAEVLYENDRFRIRFINRIGNIVNYAFNAVVELDAYGRLLEIYYYNMSYVRLGSCKIKSMEDAYYQLPIDFGESKPGKIDLKKCTLVYVYENSIVQPAYLFEGEFSDGRLFQSFVKAAVF